MSADNGDWTLYTYNNSHKPVRIQLNVGDTWESVSKSNNIDGFDSIFNKVDTNHDGIIQQGEKDALRKFFRRRKTPRTGMSQ